MVLYHQCHFVYSKLLFRSKMFTLIILLLPAYWSKTNVDYDSVNCQLNWNISYRENNCKKHFELEYSYFHEICVAANHFAGTHNSGYSRNEMGDCWYYYSLEWNSAQFYYYESVYIVLPCLIPLKETYKRKNFIINASITSL